MYTVNVMQAVQYYVYIVSIYVTYVNMALVHVLWISTSVFVHCMYTWTYSVLGL